MEWKKRAFYDALLTPPAPVVKVTGIALSCPVMQLRQMPIDQDERRLEIATIAIDLIAREGLEAATIRRIAAEAGFSTSSITHYFLDKQDLLVCAFEVLSTEGEQRFEDALLRDPSDIVGALLTLVPWCPVNVRRWKAYLAFWDEAARNNELASMLAKSTSVGTAQIKRVIEFGLADRTKAEKLSEMLNALIQGLALQMLVDGKNWNEQKAREALTESIIIMSWRFR